MVQPFLPEVKFGDKRIIILNGEPVGCLNRIPADGEFRSNLGVGGIPVLSELSDNDKKICERIKSTLLDMNLFFVGIDVIGDYLTEINVTCPTGVRQIKGLGGPDIPNLFWRQVEDLFF
jgi:glutathione synthase